MTNSKEHRLWVLFSTSLLLSLTTNTGYALVSMLQKTFVKQHPWFSKEEMSDCVGLAQSSPGPIGVNACAVVGYRAAGIPGVLAAVTGCVIPPVTIMILVSVFYQVLVANRAIALFMKGMQAGAVAMVLDYTIQLLTTIKKENTPFHWVLVGISLAYVLLTDTSVFYLALLCVLLTLVHSWWVTRKGGRQQ